MTTYINKRAKELGLRLVDATQHLEIEVTPGDVRKATKLNARKCAFAIAMRRERAEVVNAYFMRSRAWLEYNDRIVRYMLPPSVEKEIVVFDRGGAPAPGVYRLGPPRASGKLEAARQLGRKAHAKRAAKAKTGRFSPERLRTVRTERNLSQESVARSANVTQASVSRMERGLLTPTKEQISLLAKATNKKPDDFFDTTAPTKKLARIKGVRTLHEPE